MPTVGAGSYNPVGLIAMAPATNWAQRRADADRNLYYQTILTQQAEQEKNNLLIQRQSIADRYDKIRSLSFLPQDQQRLNYLAGQIEEQVQKKIKTQYGGDLKRYLQESSENDLNKFYASIQSSDVFKDATNNKINIAQYLDDNKQGKIPMLVNGRRFEDELSDFENGKTTRINYNGGYKPARDFLNRIQSSYGDDRFTKQQASKERIVQEMLNDGLTLPQAMDQYAQQGFDRLPVYHKFDDNYAKAKYILDMTLGNARLSKLNDSSEKEKQGQIDVLGVLSDPFNYGAGQSVDTTFNGQQSKSYRSNNGFIAAKEQASIMSGLGGILDRKTGIYQVSPDLRLYGYNGNSDRTLSGISAFKPSGTRLVVTPNGKELFMVGDAYMDERTAEKNGLDNFIMADYDFNGSAVINDNSLMGNPFTKNTKYTVKDVLIPLNNFTLLQNTAVNDAWKLSTKTFNADYDNVMSDLYE